MPYPNSQYSLESVPLTALNFILVAFRTSANYHADVCEDILRRDAVAARAGRRTTARHFTARSRQLLHLRLHGKHFALTS